MRVLLVKTSSMGDLIHTFPALSDAGRALPGICFDWVVEEPFAAIPLWHPLVERVISVSLRQWRFRLFSRETRTEWKALRTELNTRSYDLILDAQGLLKSAFLTLFAEGERAGLDFRSARESLAAFAYQRKYRVNFYQHAVVRMRQLFSQALNYPRPLDAPQFHLDKQRFKTFFNAGNENYIVFLHGTTWTSKQWPELFWIELGKMAAEAGFRIKISGGNTLEIERAHRLAKECPQMDVLPSLNVEEMAACLANAKGVVAVDTGLGHLAAALNVPTVSIYGATNPQYTGALGQASLHVAAHFACSPCLNRVCTFKDKTKSSLITPVCYNTVKPAQVWQTLGSLITL